MYQWYDEGRSINNLQNGIILLFLKIWKLQSIHFVGDLILNTSFKFYYDDITATSLNIL